MGSATVNLRNATETIGSSNIPELDVIELVLEFDGFAEEVARNGRSCFF